VLLSLYSLATSRWRSTPIRRSAAPLTTTAWRTSCARPRTRRRRGLRERLPRVCEQVLRGPDAL